MVSFSLGHLKLERCGGTDTREETMRVKEEEMVVETEKNSVRNTPPTDSRRFSIDEEEKVNTNKETTETGKHQRAGETKKGDGIFLLYDTERKRSICALCHVLRGSIAGTAAKTVVYPLDRLKMHLQVKAAATGQTFRLSGAPHVVKELISQGGGLSALWKGNACAVVRAFPYTGLSFYTFDLYGSFLQSQAPLHPLLCRLIAGAAAGMTATVATYPLDVLNTRMAVTKHNLSYSQVALVETQGVRSLYRGLGLTAVGIVPYAGISFCVFETLKERFKGGGEREISPLRAALCGGAAGVVSQTATYPIDTIRKLMQSSSFLYHFKEAGHIGSSSPPSVYEAFRFLYKQTGLRGLYNGVSLNWCKGFLAAGLAFSLNESGRQYFSPSFCPPHFSPRH